MEYEDDNVNASMTRSPDNQNHGPYPNTGIICLCVCYIDHVFSRFYFSLCDGNTRVCTRFSLFTPYRTCIKGMQAILPQLQHGLYPVHRCLCFLYSVFTFLYFGCYWSLSFKLFQLYTIPSNSSKVTQKNNTTMWIILFPWYIISWWISFIELTWNNS